MDAASMQRPPILVRVTREFSAPAEAVFDAWIRPESVGRWMFGPDVRDEEIVHLRVDARVGGGFSFLVRRQGVEIDHVGTYREFEPPHRLVFTWGIAGASVDESVVTIEIRRAAAGCAISLTHAMDPKWAEYADRTQAGWTFMLEALGRLLA